MFDNNLALGAPIFIISPGLALSQKLALTKITCYMVFMSCIDLTGLSLCPLAASRYNILFIALVKDSLVT